MRLTLLKIKNFVIIENVELNFGSGLNVLSGETGVGKSIIIKAIKVILGERASSDAVRFGCSEAEIQAIFECKNNKLISGLLKEMDLPFEDDELIIRRTINSKGQGKVYLNDVSITLSLLNKITPFLMEICSQFENQSLFDSKNQIEMIDSFGGFGNKTDEFREVFQSISEINRKLNELDSLVKEKDDKYEFYKFQEEEISTVNPQLDEDELLEKELSVTNNSKLLLDLALNADQVFYGDDNSIISQLETLNQKIKRSLNLDPNLSQKSELIDEFLLKAETLGRDFKIYKKNLKQDPAQTVEIEKRLEKIKKLKRKFGGSLSAVLEKHKFLQQEITKLEQIDEMKESLLDELKGYEEKAKKLGQEIHRLRIRSVNKISDLVTEQLQDLNMKGSVFKIICSYNDEKIKPHGYDDIQIMFTPNKGEPENLLSKIASGGELSRVTLAIYKILTKEDRNRIYIFDEVDSGVGGDTGKLIGKKLKEISKKNQVICISHLAQVAVFGQDHFLLQKKETGNRVSTTIKPLTESKERIEEIARMLSGDSHKKEALLHAKSLLDSVN